MGCWLQISHWTQSYNPPLMPPHPTLGLKNYLNPNVFRLVQNLKKDKFQVWYLKILPKLKTFDHSLVSLCCECLKIEWTFSALKSLNVKISHVPKSSLTFQSTETPLPKRNLVQHKLQLADKVSTIFSYNNHPPPQTHWVGLVRLIAVKCSKFCR